jgi:hypothetical protein
MPYAVLQDGPLIDLINKVQLEVTKADVSLAALFDVNSNLQKGDYKKKDGVKVYKYDNTLMAVNITGKELKAIMEEQAGKFFNQYKDGDVTISFNENIRLYNYDMFAGVEYQIDISKPIGQRIVNLTYKGAPLKEDEKLVLALNNYRYGGLSASGFISSDPEDVVYDSAATADVPAVRDMISEYVASKGQLLPECDNNWEIIGYDFDYVGAEKVYEMIRKGDIKIPTSTDGRTSNIKAINMNELAELGIITTAEAKRVVTVPEPAVSEETEIKEVAEETEVAVEYYVVKGDSLYKIAKKFHCTISEILKENPKIKNPDLIYVGQILILPE